MSDWTVDDVMTKAVVSVDKAASYRSVVDLLIERRVGALPVVDESQRVGGVVSEADVHRKIEYAGDEKPRLFDSRHRRGDRGKALAQTAAGRGGPGQAVADALSHCARDHGAAVVVVGSCGRSAAAEIVGGQRGHGDPAPCAPPGAGGVRRAPHPWRAAGYRTIVGTSGLRDVTIGSVARTRGD